jgi:hypothetical protein
MVMPNLEMDADDPVAPSRVSQRDDAIATLYGTRASVQGERAL